MDDEKLFWDMAIKDRGPGVNFSTIAEQRSWLRSAGVFCIDLFEQQCRMCSPHNESVAAPNEDETNYYSRIGLVA